MSVSASIQIELKKEILENVSIVKIVHLLLNFGWTLNDHGKTSYLPVGDRDVFDWQYEDVSFNHLKKVIQEKEKIGEVVGIVMTWKDENVGGSFLFFGKGKLSVSLDINRKLLVDSKEFKITDVNWYLERLLPIFNQGETLVEYFTYEEHI
jgi:hypothetical protein